VSRADAATILERARALLFAERDRATSDRSDESAPEDAASVALIASVAAPTGPLDQELVTFRAILDDYRAGTSGGALHARFAEWAAAAGLTYVVRHGVAVALDETERVVAALDLNPHPGGQVTRRVRSVGRRVRRVHTHGFAQVDGTWRCIADFHADGDAPDTGCGLTWEEGHGHPPATRI
jgi:hypothetical protein